MTALFGSTAALAMLTFQRLEDGKGTKPFRGAMSPVLITLQPARAPLVGFTVMYTLACAVA